MHTLEEDKVAKSLKLNVGKNIDAAVNHISKAMIQFPAQAENRGSGK